MSNFRVFIATTDGPSEIQGILEEDPDLHSVICLNGTSEALPVSRGYDAFVRKPTGVVEKLTGHRVYRMDVAAPITNGSSWQLGAYLAHMLLRCERLSLKDAAADEELLVTGALSPASMEVTPVGHIREKLQQARELLDRAGRGGALTVILPASDHQLLLEAAMAERAGFEGIAPRHVVRAAFIGLGSNTKEVEAPLEELSADEVWARFSTLIQRYMRQTQPFTSRRAMFRTDSEGDYDHLARLGEWDVSQNAVPEDVE